MDCPICSEPMMVVERHKIELDLCFFGHGLWFDLSELEMLPAALGLPIELPKELLYKEKESNSSPEALRKCPRCKSVMDKISLADDLIIDRCPQLHGFWFDKGELGQLVSQHIKSESHHQLLGFLGEVFADKRKI